MLVILQFEGAVSFFVPFHFLWVDWWGNAISVIVKRRAPCLTNCMDTHCPGPSQNTVANHSEPRLPHRCNWYPEVNPLSHSDSVDSPYPVKPSALVCPGWSDLLAVPYHVCVCSSVRATPSGCPWGAAWRTRPGIHGSHGRSIVVPGSVPQQLEPDLGRVAP